MSEQKWVPKIGDHVWHVCEYVVSSATLKAKGLEGFRNYGIEVVESVVKAPYHWENADQGCMSVSERREVGDNANSEFYWKVSDYGRSVFSTKEEAAVLAGERAHDMNRGISSTKYISRPMYKNWMHWNDEAGRKIARQAEAKAKVKRGPQRKPLPEGFEKAYTGWKNGELSNAEAARACGMPQTSFQEAAKRELVKRGEVREKFKFIRKHRTSPDDFQKVYEKWRSGEITITEAARECAMDYTSFYTRAHKKQREDCKGWSY